MLTTGALLSGVIIAIGLGSWGTALAVQDGQPIDTLLRFSLAVVLGGGCFGLLRDQLRLRAVERARAERRRSHTSAR